MLTFLFERRYRRSDELSTTVTAEDLFYPENQVTLDPLTEQGSTQKVYHVYTHPSQIYGNLWRTTEPYSPPATKAPTTTTTSTTTELPKAAPKWDIDNIYLTTMRPMPGRGRPSQRYPSNHRPHYQPATRYALLKTIDLLGLAKSLQVLFQRRSAVFFKQSIIKRLAAVSIWCGCRIVADFNNSSHDFLPHRYPYSPYRRVQYEPPLVRQEYYPMSVVGQYGGEEENAGVGVLNLLWNLVSTFASPIARLVPIPNVSKVGSENGRCLDLLACEAQRMGQFMGPTAQAVATTFR